MALQPNGAAPYTTASSATLVLDKLRDGLSGPLTADVLVRAGVGESLANRTLTSLKVLDIIDESGALAPQFQELMSLRDDEEYKARLQEWLRGTYADILQYADPTVDAPTKVAAAFRTYLPAGQRPAMAALLIGLWRYAGLPTAEPSSPNGSGAPRKPRAGGRPRQATQRAGRPSAPPTPKPTTSSLPMDDLPPGLVGLLHQIPRGGNGWPEARRDAFISAFRAVLDFSVPVRDEEPVVAGATDRWIGKEQDEP